MMFLHAAVMCERRRSIVVVFAFASVGGDHLSAFVDD
jgi:hypothetical protein